MANKGAIHISLPSAPLINDYELHDEITSTLTVGSDVDINDSQLVYLQYGGTNTIRVTLTNEYTASTGTSVYHITMGCPGYAPVTLTGAVWCSSLKIRIYITNCQLLVNGNCDWAFEADSVNFFMDVNGSGESSRLLTGAVLDFDAGNFDLRKDVWKAVFNAPTTNPAFTRCENGGADCNHPSYTWVRQVAAQQKFWILYLDGGIWKHDDITADFQDPPSLMLACDCAETFSGLPLITITSSYQVTGKCFLFSRRTVSDLGTCSCICPTGGTLINEVYQETTDSHRYGGYFAIIPKTSGIYPFQKSASSLCADSSSTFSSGVEVGITKCQHEMIINGHGHYVNFCFITLSGPEVCGVTPPSPGCCDGYTIVDCCFSAGSNYLHTDIPPCNTDNTSPGSIHITKVQEQGLNYAIIANNGSLVLERFNVKKSLDSHLPVYSVPMGHTLGFAQVSWHRSGNLVVVYEEDAVIYRITNGGTGAVGQWSTPMTVASGKNPATAVHDQSGIEFCAIYVTDRWKLYQLIPGAGSFTLVGTIAVTATDNQAAGLEFSTSAENILVFEYNDVGTITRLTSGNFGNTWS